jgi:phage terminase large subunit-like protein
MKVDRTTKRWIRNASDERAVANGCTFDAARGEFVVNWLESCLCLYEGEMAGEPFKCMDWQRDFLMRLFGWVRFSERWKRNVRRFTQASLWVPKKNGKSPLLAALGLYLLSADGEQGQKVYFAAKDGTQAREIAGKHAIEMCLSSEQLTAECTINRSLMQITHEETRSILKPLSSSDSRSQKSKEGLNGSILVDETHVVDRDFMDRISRAGISRSEPLLIEASTAGDEPESYGKERFDYGAMVEKGEIVDERLLYIAYAAPQLLMDDELANDPVKFGRNANPSWGVTIAEEEFVDDYQRSHTSLSKLALFKMYRLNVWQQSDNPWLRQSDWVNCAAEYDADQLSQRDCFIGMDLAKVRDTTALVAVFPPMSNDGDYLLWPLFYLPMETARNVSHVVPYQEWSKEGFITLTDGDVCDYEEVRAGLNWMRDHLSVIAVGYDPYFSDVLIQRLQEEDGWREEQLVKFPQTISHFAGPTEEFERLVISGRMRHPDNKLMNWQAGHCKVKTDANRNKRPVKPRHGDHKTIDGMVAAIMGLGISMNDESGGPSVYEQAGKLTL